MEENKISARVVAHSKSSVTGKEIVTFELIYPRFIHSELMTHRLFSRNAASSRAIPVSKMIEMVRDNPAMPIHWGKNQPGMQAKEECLEQVFIQTFYDNAIWQGKSEEEALAEAHVSAKHAWGFFAGEIADIAERFSIAGYHKQIVNRILEPFQIMKTVVTSTEWDNWFWLRNHPDAQPEIKRLAEVMWEAKEESEPQLLHPGWWHVPYFDNGYWCPFMMDEDCYDNPTTLKEALAISSSCCAQVSYRKLDDSLEKAQDIFAKLIESKPCHASPTEHQATPMEESGEFWDESGEYGVNCLCDPDTWQEGITHVDRNGNFWSGNFKGFVQHRQLIPDNACWNYSPDGDKE